MLNNYILKQYLKYFKALNVTIFSLCKETLLTYFFSHGQALRVDDGGKFFLFELFNSVLVISQVQLGAHQDDWRVGAVVSHLRVPLQGEKKVRGYRMQIDNMRDCGMWVGR